MQLAVDREFGFGVRAVRLQREVEMYQTVTVRRDATDMTGTRTNYYGTSISCLFPPVLLRWNREV